MTALPKGSILTPHLGELKRLIGEWSNDYDRLRKAKEFAKKYDVTLVIKGANTITISDEKMVINTTGNPGMATAGSGDVLAGIITALLSQGYNPFEASIFGVYLHGSSGNIAADNLGFEAMIASDIIENLGDAYVAIFTQEPQAVAEDQESHKK